MLKKHNTQFKFQMLNLEDLVPQDHLLRLVDRYIDFSFIEQLTYDLYCHDNGRPAIDPVVLFKMLFVGYIYGIRSERRLVEEFNVNIAYRWFIGYDLDDKIPNHSTFSQNRRRKFSQRPELEQEIFDRIVEQAIDYGLVSGSHLYTDSTHIKANANKNKFKPAIVANRPVEYLQELQDDIDNQRQAIGKKPFYDDDDQEPPASGSGREKSREIKQSTTDPDSGFMTRDGKPKGFFYLDHRTVDGANNIIVDCHVTAGNINDARPYPQRLLRTITRFDFNPIAVGIDAGYRTAYIAKFLHDIGLYGVSGYKRVSHRNKDLFYPRQFLYDGALDCYLCPNKQQLTLRTIDRNGYRHYSCGAQTCRGCPLKASCTTGQQKIVSRHIWQDYLDELDSHRLSPQGKKIYKRRKETVERSFADSKEMHGLRYARFRGLSKVRGQCLLVAACQNMKKIARLMAKRDRELDPDGSDYFSIFMSCMGQIAGAVEGFLQKVFNSHTLMRGESLNLSLA